VNSPTISPDGRWILSWIPAAEKNTSTVLKAFFHGRWRASHDLLQLFSEMDPRSETFVLLLHPRQRRQWRQCGHNDRGRVAGWSCPARSPARRHPIRNAIAEAAERSDRRSNGSVSWSDVVDLRVSASARATELVQGDNPSVIGAKASDIGGCTRCHWNGDRPRSSIRRPLRVTSGEPLTPTALAIIKCRIKITTGESNRGDDCGNLAQRSMPNRTVSTAPP
jgi:hypothetical protein